VTRGVTNLPDELGPKRLEILAGIRAIAAKR
jgi:hypothetical protein